MSSAVILLVLTSTLMHAGWNLLARHQRSEIAFFTRMLTTCIVIGFIPAVVTEVLTGSMTSTAWWCLLGSGFCCGFYFLGLGRAYGSSDFTIVYPVARALPVLLIGLGDMFRGRPPTLDRVGSAMELQKTYVPERGADEQVRRLGLQTRFGQSFLYGHQ